MHNIFLCLLDQRDEAREYDQPLTDIALCVLLCFAVDRDSRQKEHIIIVSERSPAVINLNLI